MTVKAPYGMTQEMVESVFREEVCKLIAPAWLRFHTQHDEDGVMVLSADFSVGIGLRVVQERPEDLVRLCRTLAQALRDNIADEVAVPNKKRGQDD